MTRKRDSRAGARPGRGGGDLLRLVGAGRLLYVIGARFPLERIVEAHEAQESGTVTGNIVVDWGRSKLPFAHAV